MVRDYVEELYEPTAAHADAARPPTARARARALAAWKARVVAAWPGVHVDGVEADDGPAELGSERAVAVDGRLGALAPDDVEVQLLHGPVGQGDELAAARRSSTLDPRRRPPTTATSATRADFRCERGRPLRLHRAGRARPPDLVTPVELGRVAWA